ncbi:MULTISPECIES: helix-turn-helix domain-containing protein [Nocardia]|uniref:helix-turn-helix domain-containing protein n=1 Tax=Nocardia TaxID=1817 RepID=UPI002455B0AB|nr:MULTISPECIES: helix-turn-helix transcriptional regulator [Nocardia]
MRPQWAFGQRLQQAREAAPMRKREAAKRAGISEARWRQLERGFESVRGIEVDVRTTPETVARVASAVGLDINEMLELAGFNPDLVGATPSGIGVETVDVSGLSPEAVDKVREFVKFMKYQEKG